MLVILIISGCANNNLRMDTDQNTDFSTIQQFSVIAIHQQDSLGNQRLIQATEAFLRENGKEISAETGGSGALIELDHYEQERPNQSRLSLGLGTGSYGRSGGVSLGTSVSVPLGADMLPHAVIEMKVLVDQRLVWSASNSQEIDTDNSNGKAEAQLKALQGLLEAFPLNRQ